MTHRFTSEMLRQWVVKRIVRSCDRVGHSTANTDGRVQTNLPWKQAACSNHHEECKEYSHVKLQAQR
ncbi:hypothetical protein TNCV_1737141 [Trichonephila clavipes]|nr:hypothetical protein TNCV_1737141 [Trichonephila clavipes]